MSAYDEFWPILKQQGIQSLRIDYSGSGDEGYVESIDAEWLPEVHEAIAKLPPSAQTKLSLPDSVEDSIRELTYQVVNRVQPGWEINEGSSGFVQLDVASETATVRHVNYVITGNPLDPQEV